MFLAYIDGHTFVFFPVVKLAKRGLEQISRWQKILAEFAMTREMEDQTCRDLVNIVVAHMVEKYG